MDVKVPNYKTAIVRAIFVFCCFTGLVYADIPDQRPDSMNMSLRHVARHAGLSLNPTIHEARHTFATTVTLSQGVPLETVNKMLGYKHITTTAHLTILHIVSPCYRTADISFPHVPA